MILRNSFTSMRMTIGNWKQYYFHKCTIIILSSSIWSVVSRVCVRTSVHDIDSICNNNCFTYKPLLTNPQFFGTRMNTRVRFFGKCADINLIFFFSNPHQWTDVLEWDDDGVSLKTHYKWTHEELFKKERKLIFIYIYI